MTETYGDFVVTQQSIEAFGDYVVRKLEVSKQSSEAAAVMSEPSLVVTQFHFTRWKAKEYPHRSASLLDLIQDVNRVQMNTNNKPIVVICKYVRSSFIPCLVHVTIALITVQSAL